MNAWSIRTFLLQSVLLQMAEKEVEGGVIVSTGTERSFFDLAASDKCTGVVIRDINPKVKAYNDFNTLLLRIANNRNEYIEMATPPKSLTDRIVQITKKIERDYTLPEKIATYYKKNINPFCNIYYYHSSNASISLGCVSWQTRQDYDACNYYKRDDLFSKLQKHARSGNIISTIGDINNLMFLRGIKISIVDTSNICDYSMIDLHLQDESTPRILWTQVGYLNTLHHSFINKSLTKAEKIEFDRLLELIKSCTSFEIDEYSEAKWMTVFLGKYCDNGDIFNTTVGASHSKKTLDRLEQYCKEYIICTSTGKYFNLHSHNIGKFLNKATPEELKELCAAEKTVLFVKDLVHSCYRLNPDTYLAFSALKGWKEEFEALFIQPMTSLSFFKKINEEQYRKLAKALGGEEMLIAFLKKRGLTEQLLKDFCPFSKLL